MKVLFYCPLPFALAHGGQQIQIECTQSALQAIGVEVEPLRWWDPTQRGDVIHYFGRPSGDYVRLAQQKGMKVVIEEFLTATGSRSRAALALQRGLIRLARRTLPASWTARMGWEAYRQADACLANTAWEAYLIRYLFGAPVEKVHVLPNGVEAVFLESPASLEPRQDWLICTATITERKRVWELAQAAVLAKTPLRIFGKPYAEHDPYAQRCLRYFRDHASLIRYEGALPSRSALAQAYRQARGFVLLSDMETRSLAAEEAAACGCPLLLSDLPWARSVFGPHARYCPVTRSVRVTARILREFYEAAPSLPAPPRPLSWTDVARQLKAIYDQVLSTKPSDKPGA